VAGFYSARSRTIPPLPWPTFAPPLSVSLRQCRPKRAWSVKGVPARRQRASSGPGRLPRPRIKKIMPRI